MTGKCNRCGEVDRLFFREDGIGFCYSCKRVSPLKKTDKPILTKAPAEKRKITLILLGKK